MTGRIWTAANWVMFGLFVLSAIVQINDPDPLRWIVVYGCAAAVCLLEARRRTRWLFPTVVAVVALAAAVVIGGNVHGVVLGDLVAEWEMKDAGVEQAREAGGLLIVVVWMAVVAVASRWRTRSNSGRVHRAADASR